MDQVNRNDEAWLILSFEDMFNNTRRNPVLFDRIANFL